MEMQGGRNKNNDNALEHSREVSMAVVIKPGGHRHVITNGREQERGRGTTGKVTSGT
jgi:hypothetical protein